MNTKSSGAASSVVSMPIIYLIVIKQIVKTTITKRQNVQAWVQGPLLINFAATA